MGCVSGHILFSRGITTSRIHQEMLMVVSQPRTPDFFPFLNFGEAGKSPGNEVGSLASLHCRNDQGSFTPN